MRIQDFVIVDRVRLEFARGPNSILFGQGNLSGIATVSLTVTPNQPPVAIGDNYSTLVNTPLIVGAPGVLVNNAARDAEYEEILDSVESFEDEIRRETRKKRFRFAELEEGEADWEKLKRWFAREFGAEVAAAMAAIDSAPRED